MVPLAAPQGKSNRRLTAAGSDEYSRVKLPNVVVNSRAARLQETDEWVWDLLSQSQQAQISASWRRFRHRVTGNDSSGGFFGV